MYFAKYVINTTIKRVPRVYWSQVVLCKCLLTKFPLYSPTVSALASALSDYDSCGCPLKVIIHSFIHSIGMCRMRRFLAVLRSFFHSSLLYTLSFHHFQPTSFPYSLTWSYHLFLGLLLSITVSKFIYNTFLGILFSSILCTCPNQRNNNIFIYCIWVVTRWQWLLYM